MIRLLLALTALLALNDVTAQELDYVELNRCMNSATGYVCPDGKNNGRTQGQEMRRVMTRAQARVYCECVIVNSWESKQVDLCMGLARVCEYGDL